ncbi:MAG: MOSC domain-containing protein [Bryobacteraceae bacterium]
MNVVGRVESVWRYPVKSMRGEELDEAFLGVGGLRGDRVFAIHNARARQDFPYFTAREQGKMLLCRPMHREGSETDLEVETPGGEKLTITDRRLVETLRAGLRDGFELTLLQSERALTDCSPVSILSNETVRQLTQELGKTLDKRRFRANIYVDLATGQGFSEDQLVGHRLRIGPNVLLMAVERDDRCKMITLDPETAEPTPELMKLVAASHESRVGIYADVLAEGTVRPGDRVEVAD